jgi:peptidoglycan/LPS O-acetylase OafA/YrhL
MLNGQPAHDVPLTIFSFLLFPQKESPVLAVGWTLIHEFMFYYFVCLVILLGRGKRLVFYTGLAALFGVALCLLDVKILNGYVFSEYYVEFFVGSLAFIMHKRLSIIFPWLQLAVGFLLYFVVSYLLDTHLGPIPNKLIGVLGCGTIGFLLINGLIGLDAQYRLASLAFGRFWARLGNASYSMYLSHWFVLSLIGKLAAPFSLAPISFIVIWHIGAILLTVVIAVLFAEFVELPLHQRVLRLVNKSGPVN